ncbi:Gfo/Idh/MocA family protein [Cohnella phaseoli]|uniref:Putative dehydrogenase n=1 Tax=Cohnella phaseoli TaxID=456490 RepID=A0A3D9IRQ6_9BACL|nr:Gfo/Idh/MocA family oxidoreductase [Cohnella phaseoli]RED64491.1 putative dehydrogenase [Cohnella phaseoli]
MNILSRNGDARSAGRRPLKLGIIGLDTSHVVAFAELLHDAAHPYHVPGAIIESAYSSVSPDFEMSYARVEGFTARMKEEFGVRLLDTPEAVAEASDAILLESVDARVHCEQFRAIAAFGKPVFIDKPLTIGYEDAYTIVELAARHGIPVMSASALRYSQALTDALAAIPTGELYGIDAYGPMTIQPTQPGLYWYGIHMTEMLYASLGTGCKQVTAVSNAVGDCVIGEWADGRLGAFRGNRMGNTCFGAVLHGRSGSRHVDASAHPKPYYAGLLEAVLAMFRSGVSPIPPDELLEVVRFLEAGNRSRLTGEPVRL